MKKAKDSSEGVRQLLDRVGYRVEDLSNEEISRFDRLLTTDSNV